MTHEKASQPGAEEPSASAPQAAHNVSGPAPRLRTTGTKPRPSGYAAAFGDASGAAFVFRDLASI